MKRISVCILAFLALGATAAVGQVIYNNASTAAEGYGRGLGDVISAQGSKNLSDSQAAINLTEARSNQIDNQIKSVNAYWEKKSIYNEYQQRKDEDVQQQRAVAESIYGLKSLSPEEFDRSTGQVNWLKVLEQKPYDQYRTVIDDAFKTRAYKGALTGDEYMSATTASKQWRALLATQKDQYPQGVLSQMIRFILKLDRELNDNLG